MTGKKPKYYPPANYKAVTIYLTPAQHQKIKAQAEEESKRISKQAGRPVRISMADCVRNLIDKL